VTHVSDVPRRASAAAGSTSAPAEGHPTRYRRLLIPFDGSATARRAFDEALVLARDRGASIEIFHVFDPATHVSGFEPARLLVDELLPRARARVQADCEAIAQSAQAAGVDCHICLVDGDVADLPDVIARHAADTGADLVVMGTHGRTGMERLFLGSVAEELLRRAGLPVLLVRLAEDGS